MYKRQSPTCPTSTTQRLDEQNFNTPTYMDGKTPTPVPNQDNQPNNPKTTTEPTNPILTRTNAPTQPASAPLTDILTAAREFVTFFNEARGLLDLIRSFRSGGLPALLTTLTDLRAS